MVFNILTPYANSGILCGKDFSYLCGVLPNGYLAGSINRILFDRRSSLKFKHGIT